MDKVLSARVNEAVLLRIGLLSRKLGITKKAVIEKAVLLLAETTETGVDPFKATSGSWKRNESPAETVDDVRDSFRKSMNRYRA